MKILANIVVFQKRFNRITNGILEGLDWSKVFIAGGIALTTLLCTDEAQETASLSKDADIDLYMYGLDAEGANAKAKHIYNVWFVIFLPRRKAPKLEMAGPLSAIEWL